MTILSRTSLRVANLVERSCRLRIVEAEQGVFVACFAPPDGWPRSSSLHARCQLTTEVTQGQGRVKPCLPMQAPRSCASRTTRILFTSPRWCVLSAERSTSCLGAAVYVCTRMGAYARKRARQAPEGTADNRGCSVINRGCLQRCPSIGKLAC
jgi:hypothetical protein